MLYIHVCIICCTTNISFNVFSSGGNASKEGIAGFRLGTAYEEVGDPETAILVRIYLNLEYIIILFSDPSHAHP